MTKLTFGKSPNLKKLLDAEHFSPVNGVKHFANAAMKNAMTTHYNDESQNIASFRDFTINNAAKILGAKNQKCLDDFHHANLVKEFNITVTNELYSNCTGNANTAYNTTATAAGTNFNNSLIELGTLLENAKEYLFDVEAAA